MFGVGDKLVNALRFAAVRNTASSGELAFWRQISFISLLAPHRADVMHLSSDQLFALQGADRVQIAFVWI